MPAIERMVEAVSRVVEQALGVNLLDMIIQIAATLILVIIVKIFFWGRITAFLEKRKQIMETEMESAKKENEEAKVLKEKHDFEYNQLKQESKQYLDNAKIKADQERKRILVEAKENANEILERTQKEIEAEKIKAKAELKKEAVELAALMAEKIVSKEIDESSYQNLLIDDLERSEKS
ncbi:MAG: F0F1 ATP synthase subunit B [Candidatus Izemoplasmatales bacterium]|jgi:F-type H+-transporting ATPase subunit b|nr:F0F1 ATP synthase subunit B [Candidatus Izemoplasmatales bacterium]HPD99917.1 F0F1 ATP synthase subunit B [Bacillota bacterium]